MTLNRSTVVDNKFQDILTELGELHRIKDSFYSSDVPLSNFRPANAWNIPPWVGAMLRLNDKLSRIQNMYRNNLIHYESYESIEDNLKDLAVYSIIALQLYRESLVSTVEESSETAFRRNM